jgi:hypothetical protein
MSRNTAPLPESGMYRAIRLGHKSRTGHELDAYLVTYGDGIWHIVRNCCEE